MALDVEQSLLAGRYRQLSTLGTGGMARVLLAEDERLGRRVAVKQMHSTAPEDSARRLHREARLGASLSHANLVSVFDVETDGESVLIVMEYVDGETLKDALARGPLDSRRALAIVRDVAAALDHAHAQGVVHRDVKPANVLIGSDGAAKLADLGIATAAESTRITRSGTVLGTAAYMAPEQLEGEEAGPAADVYSLAVLAFEALSGRKAREGTTPMEIAHRTATEPPPDLHDAWPGAPARAAEALKRGMARDPASRPASAGELADALERGLAEDRTASTLLAPSRSEHRGRPRWVPVAAAAAALALVGGVALAGLGGGDDGGSKDARGGAERKEPAEKAKAKPKGEEPKAAPAAPSEPAPAAGQPAGNPAALNDQAFRLMNQGRHEDAIPLLQRAVDSYGAGSRDLTYAYALYNLGRSLRLAGRPGDAIPVLERRLRIPNQQAVVKRELEQARRAAQ